MSEEGVCLRVLSRPWCHLCHDLVAALAPLARERGLAFEVVDVDELPALEAVWGEAIPVVLAGDCCVYAGPVRGDALRAALDRWLRGAA